MRKICFAVAGLFYFIVLSAIADDFVVLGDMPYGDDESTVTRYSALIKNINDERLSFVVHVGDVKSGSSECSDESFEMQRAFFARVDHPLIYTPGDNEWTDCHRITNGSYDPLERLTRLRDIFFDESYFHATTSINLASQGLISDSFSEFVENQIWSVGDSLFVAVHIVGSNNNISATSKEGKVEYERRLNADIAWLEKAFSRLKHEGFSSLVIFFHGDPFVDWMTRLPSKLNTGFERIIGDTLIPLAINSKKTVLIVHGDTHVFRWDSPMRWEGRPISNVSRVVVPGAKDMRALRISKPTGQHQAHHIEIFE